MNLLGAVKGDQSSNERQRDECDAGKGDWNLLLVRHFVRIPEDGRYRATLE
jgi:hypothetical protein